MGINGLSFWVETCPLRSFKWESERHKNTRSIEAHEGVKMFFLFSAGGGLRRYSTLFFDAPCAIVFCSSPMVHVHSTANICFDPLKGPLSMFIDPSIAFVY